MVVLAVAAFILLLGVATYYLFFAPVPFIEKIASPDFNQAAQISSIKLDPTAVSASPVFKLLSPQVSLPITGSFGRENPFATFVQSATPLKK